MSRIQALPPRSTGFPGGHSCDDPCTTTGGPTGTVQSTGPSTPFAGVSLCKSRDYMLLCSSVALTGDSRFLLPIWCSQNCSCISFLKRNNPPRIKRSESKKEETVKGLSATWAPSYPDAFLTCIQHSLVETLYPFIKQAGVDTTPWLFYTNRSLLHARCFCFFSPVLSYRFVQAQHPHSWGYIVWLWQMMLPVLYHWLLGLQTFRGLCRVVVSILMYACFLTHVRLSADSLDSLFLSMQLHVQRKQEN